MIELTETYSVFRETLSADEMPAVARRLQSTGEELARAHYGAAFDELQITVVVQIESGSTKTWMRIFGLMLAIEQGVEHYGAFRDGATRVADDARALGQLLAQRAPSVLGLGTPTRIQVRPGVPERLRAIIDRVAAGQLDPGEATSKALRLIESSTEEGEQESSARVQDSLLEEIELAAARASIRPLPSHQVDRVEKPVKKKPSERKREPAPVREPALPPEPRRRRGVIAIRDRRTGELLLRRY